MLLKVKDLSIYFPNYKKYKTDKIYIVDNISFSLGFDKIALVGSSGSGKSMTAKALLNIVPCPGIVTAKDLQILGPIAMITQDAKYSLNPVLKIGYQIAECYKVHFKVGRAAANKLTLDILDEVKIKNPKLVYNQYPHQISGGMAQRVMIAMMLACCPKILIADEATSALDPETQHDIIQLLTNICNKKNMGLIMISHDLPLVASFCDRVLVMYQGKIIDRCKSSDLNNSKNNYTQALWNCCPSKAKSQQKILPEYSYD